MASFRVLHSDGSIARNTKVTISVDRGGMVNGITDLQGYVTISTSGNSGKIIVKGSTVYQGSLNVSEIRIG